MSDTDFLDELADILRERREADPGDSYVASLHARGLNKILEKVGEEAVETVLAAKDGDTGAIVHETADLWFHTLVMLDHYGLSHRDIISELNRRFGVSGHDEKASRTPAGTSGPESTGG